MQWVVYIKLLMQAEADMVVVATAEAVATVANNIEITSNEIITKDTKHKYVDISNNKELVLLVLIAHLLMVTTNSEI